jgi:hypothetical protein
MDDVRQLQAEICQWQRRTFPHGTVDSVVAHLVEEALELAADPTDGTEMADVAILLMGVADRAGVDLWAAVAAKHAVNERRQWGRVEANGVVHHVEGA